MRSLADRLLENDIDPIAQEFGDVKDQDAEVLEQFAEFLNSIQHGQGDALRPRIAEFLKQRGTAKLVGDEL